MPARHVVSGGRRFTLATQCTARDYREESEAGAGEDESLHPEIKHKKTQSCVVTQCRAYESQRLGSRRQCPVPTVPGSRYPVVLWPDPRISWSNHTVTVP
eukprot:513579-Rhodomonas_salina.1